MGCASGAGATSPVALVQATTVRAPDDAAPTPGYEKPALFPAVPQSRKRRQTAVTGDLDKLSKAHRQAQASGPLL